MTFLNFKKHPSNNLVQVLRLWIRIYLKICCRAAEYNRLAIFYGLSGHFKSDFLNLQIKKLRLESHVKSFANFSCQLIDSDSSLGVFYYPFFNVR